MMKLLVAVAVTICLPISAAGQVGSNLWTSNGPSGAGEVSAIIVDPITPSNLYAASASNGVFKSADGGAAWTPVNNGLTDRNINAMEIDPLAPGTLYAATDSGVFKTIDAAALWIEINNGLPAQRVRALAIDPSTPATIYAGFSRLGVYKSTDAGASWVEINEGLADLFILSLAVDPSNPSTLYAGTESQQVFKSDDGGAGWTSIGDGLPLNRTRALAVYPRTPSTVFAGMSTAGVFRSLDGGLTWTHSSSGIVGSVQDIVIDSANPENIYAATNGRGVFKSCDGGETWVPINNGLIDDRVGALALDPSGETLYAGTDSGVFTLFLLHQLFLAQFGNGDGFVSMIMLMNPSPTETALGRVDLYSDDGTSLSVPLERGIQEVGGVPLGNPASEFAIPPLSSQMLMTDGLGEVIAGSALVVSDLPLTGNIEFTVPDVGMAGVAASEPLSRFMVMVRNQARGIRSGIAFQNVQNLAVRVTLRLQVQGQEVPNGIAQVDLPPFGHLARFVEELFPDAETSEFIGTLIGETDQGRIAVTAMDLGSKVGEFASLVVTALP